MRDEDGKVPGHMKDQRKQAETQSVDVRNMPAISWMFENVPAKAKVDVTKCHACHANSRGDNGAKRRPKRATRASPVP